MRSRSRGTALVAVMVLCLGVANGRAQDRAQHYEGRTLGQALQMLQAKGLRIVFSSETVTAEMRVLAEPRATSARRVLDELLSAHGLTTKPGPGGVIQVVRAKASASTAQRKDRTVVSGPKKPDAPVTSKPAGPSSEMYREHVTVSALWPEPREPGVTSAISLDGDQLRGLYGVAADDPIRAVHALPRVAASDDFRSEFSVRGSPYRHLGVVVDGVATPWLRHAVQGGDTGSVTMLNSQVLERATLSAGAYPQRHGDTIGAELGLILREGSREGPHVRGILGGSNATLVAEGPLGRSQRGSWLFSGRRSYLDWPIAPPGKDSTSRTGFGFADAQAKLVFDVRPTQQLSLVLLGGHSRLDSPDDPTPGEVAHATNRTAVINAGWRSAFGSGLIVNQRAYLVAHDFLNQDQRLEPIGRGVHQELAYRADATRAMFGGLLEVGGQIQRVNATRSFLAERFGGVSWMRSGYAHFIWRATPRLTLAPGMRVAHSTLVGRHAIGRWILGEFALKPDWTLHAGAGVSHQFAEIEHVLAASGTPGLKPEQGAHFDVGVEHRPAPSIRWQATVFGRAERRLVGSLDGRARGVELLFERHSATGLSGWAAYSYGRTRHTDLARGETFWADFDQRHAVTLSGVYRLSPDTSFEAKFRGGSNFPIPGYFVRRGDGLFVGARRNEVRLKSYARLDVRASRTFATPGPRLTLFAEILNVLNRPNHGLADGYIHPLTGEAIGFTERLFPRVPTAGLIISF